MAQAPKSTVSSADLESRLSYLKGGQDPHINGESVGLALEVHNLEIGTYTPVGGGTSPAMKIDFVRAAVVGLSKSERVQYATNNSDDGKVYFFNDELHMYNISCFMVDSDLDAQQIEASGGTTGFTISRWKDVYNQTLRVPLLVRRNKILSFKWRGVQYWGYVVSYSLSIAASDPNMATLSLVFLCLWENNEYVPDTLETVTGDILADLSQEGYAMLFNDFANMGEELPKKQSSLGKRLETLNESGGMI